MWKLLFILFILGFGVGHAQTLYLYDVDTTQYPLMKAKLFVIDANGQQIHNLKPDDFELTENGIPREIKTISCTVSEPTAVSSVLVFDMSNSMSYGAPNIDAAKKAANAWVDGLPIGQSECALVSFDYTSLLIKDFTKDKSILKDCIALLKPFGGTDYNEALINQPCGGLNIAQKGKYKKVVVFLTDGLPNFEPRTDEIISFAKVNNITIYGVTLEMPAPQCIKDITRKTGGEYLENITTPKEAKETYIKLLNLAMNNKPCEIEWTTSAECNSGMIDLELKLIPNNIVAKKQYSLLNSAVSSLSFSPKYLNFKEIEIGKTKQTNLTVTAHNAEYEISNIKVSNSKFSISPSTFRLKSGESKILTVSYTPTDSNYNICTFELENTRCSSKFIAKGGYVGKKPITPTLKILFPNGNEELVVGTDTTLTWDGILENEPVKIEYSLDNGLNWKLIDDNYTGNSYNWRVPNSPSESCILRITAKFADNPSNSQNPDVMLCSQIWMGSNLNVATYKNGEAIRYARNQAEWLDAASKKEGAWCYYNDDPANGEIYGKLYNGYAVRDSRGLAPEGWKLPSIFDWDELIACLEQAPGMGGRLKEAGTAHWASPNTGANNDTYFTALPAGIRKSDGSFSGLGFVCQWWYSTANGSKYLGYDNDGMSQISCLPSEGLPVRCVLK